MKIIFDGATGNVTSDAFEVGTNHRTLFVWGTFASATVKLQLSPDGQTWFDHADRTFTAAGEANVFVSPGTRARGVITDGAGASIHMRLT